MFLARAALLVFLRLPSGVASDQGSGPRGKHIRSFKLRFLLCPITIIRPNNHLSAFKMTDLPSAQLVFCFLAAAPNVFKEAFFMESWKFFVGSLDSSLSLLNVA